MRFDLGLAPSATLIVLHNYEGSNWEIIPDDRVVQNADGTVDVTFDSLSPIAFVVDSTETDTSASTDANAPTSPQTGGQQPASRGRRWADCPGLRGPGLRRCGVEEARPELNEIPSGRPRPERDRGNPRRGPCSFGGHAVAAALGEHPGRACLLLRGSLVRRGPASLWTAGKSPIITALPTPDERTWKRCSFWVWTNSRGETPEGYVNNQQADFLLLLVMDKQHETCTPIQLNRDTMTQIQILGVTGEPAGTFTGQLALAHTYGSGEEDSCENTVLAVENLLYGMEIDHYVSLTMDGGGPAQRSGGRRHRGGAGRFLRHRRQFGCRGETVTLQGAAGLDLCPLPWRPGGQFQPPPHGAPAAVSERPAAAAQGRGPAGGWLHPGRPAPAQRVHGVRLHGEPALRPGGTAWLPTR